VQFSEDDNSPAHLWENISEATARVSPGFAEKSRELGFPDTREKFERFLEHRRSALKGKYYIIVFDDVHFLSDPDGLAFMEKAIAELPPNLTLLLISRNVPRIDIKTLQMKGLVSEINEEDLNFTEIEIAGYLKQQGLLIDSQTVREIREDTKGWVFAVNLVARSLKRVPKYAGFVKPTLKPNIFEFMEAENWNALSERLGRFLLRLSLIDRISAELADILADGDEELLSELKRQNAYIRFDNFGGAYLIHHLYLDFLKSKQDLLTSEEKIQVYKTAADWCNRNNFKVDALTYFEKVGDYEAIVCASWELYENTSPEVLMCAAEIIERAPAEIMDKVDFFMAFHLFTLIYSGKIDEFFELSETYEQRLLRLPENSVFRNNTLGAIYLLLGNVYFLMCTFDDYHEFEDYYSKAAECLSVSQPEEIKKIILPHGAWVSTLGSGKADSLSRYTDTIERSVEQLTLIYNGANGFDDLYLGEIKFYQNDLREAEALFQRAFEQGAKYNQFDTVHRAWFYILRIAIAKGNLTKAEQALKKLEALLDEVNYSRRSFSYDIAYGWYSCVIRQFDTVPDWLKGDFAAYHHAHFVENYSNQIKARYCFLNRNYTPLLTYINEMKERESILYGRVEMLATEACIHYQMKNKEMAWDALKDAYDASAPNNIIMPFIELGKDMRTLTMVALREGTCEGIPNAWLESIKNKATSYAKNQSMFVTEHKLSEASPNKALSAREQDVLSDLYHGYSQAEIAKKHNLSINTVKMVTKNIYEKLHVHKISDLIRVAAEQRLV
jgi:LuxR family maltose regulon positive regulatory protein